MRIVGLRALVLSVRAVGPTLAQAVTARPPVTLALNVVHGAGRSMEA